MHGEVVLLPVLDTETTIRNGPQHTLLVKDKTEVHNQLSNLKVGALPCFPTGWGTTNQSSPLVLPHSAPILFSLYPISGQATPTPIPGHCSPWLTSI